MAEEDSPCLIVDLSNEPVRVSFDVEHREFTRGICRREDSPHIHQILPLSPLDDPIPNIQRLAEIVVLLRRFEQLFATDNVQSQPPFH